MENRRIALQALMDKLPFPEYSQKTFLDSYDRITGDKVGRAWFLSLLRQYDNSEKCNYPQMQIDMKALGEALGVHEYTSAMLMFLCMGEKLRERYAERGIEESIYYHTMMDFRYKLDECRMIYGIDGLVCGFWYPGFFNVTRFALGRLQFELVNTKVEVTLDGVTYPAGSKAVNMHIPRTGTKLDHDEVLEAYRLAAEMYEPEFPEQPVLFHVYSWLLAPWHLDVLGPESNLALFIKDFKYVESGTYADYSSAWRIFDCPFTGDITALPRKTSLQRAYAERMERGEPFMWGRGFFLYRDGRIINE